jgi:hypothetical protein
MMINMNIQKVNDRYISEKAVAELTGFSLSKICQDRFYRRNLAGDERRSALHGGAAHGAFHYCYDTTVQPPCAGFNAPRGAETARGIGQATRKGDAVFASCGAMIFECGKP